VYTQLSDMQEQVLVPCHLCANVGWFRVEHP
jgi:hypothetical protein